MQNPRGWQHVCPRPSVLSFPCLMLPVSDGCVADPSMPWDVRDGSKEGTCIDYDEESESIAGFR